MNISDKLKTRRKELGLTMLEVSKKANVSEATVSRWESGDIANMRRDKIVLLAKALQVPPSFIMDYGGNMNNLKKLRQTHNLSQTAFAKMLGVAQNTVSNWENGNRFIDNETLKRISSMFDVSIDYLLGNEVSSLPQLSENEQYLIDKFRNLSWKAQSHVLQTVDILSEK